MMNQLVLLRRRADELLQVSVGNEKEHKIFEIIKNRLEDDDCFLNMDIEHAYAILRDLGIGEELVSSYYSSLIAR